jgi:tRNA threonylcarbamoyladenosine biosynthesis protein TsaB
MTVVLAIETATAAVEVGLLIDHEPVQSWSSGRTRHHTEHLLAMIDDALVAAGRTSADLDAIAVDPGPGLFTGLRVGLATAKGLAVALVRPVVACTSLEILAAAVARDLEGPCVSVVDGRRGEVFAQAFTVANGHATPSSAARTCTPDDLCTFAPARSTLVGDGAVLLRSTLAVQRPDCTVLEDPTVPPAATLAHLGRAAIEAGGGMDPAALVAHYLRDADARVNFSVRTPAP